MSKKIEQEQVFLTSTQAATLLNISMSTLKKLISLGKIKTIRTPGGHYRIDREQLIASLYAEKEESK